MPAAAMDYRLAQGLVPEGAIAPPMRMLWLPLDTGGTTTGASFPSGFARRIGITGTTRNDPATLTVTSGTVSLEAVGGLKFNTSANANIALSPASGDALTFLDQLLDLGALGVGQTVMVGMEVQTPAGWAAALTSSSTWLSVGGFGSTDGGGWGVGVSSNERPTIFWRAVGASAVGASIVNLVGVDTTGSLVDNARNAVVFELQCTAAHTYKARAHLSSSAGTTYTGAWSSPVDLSAPGQSGTAAPGPVASAGVRLGGRKDLTANANRMNQGEILRNVWAVQFPAPPRESIGPRCCEEMLLRMGCRPRTLTLYDEDAVDIADSPDGSYDAGFGVLTLGDAFVAFDGKRAITDHPQFTVICETGTDKGSNKSTNIDELNPYWVETASFAGTMRAAATPGGRKFGITTDAPASVAYPAFVFSSYRTDASNRSRAELGWRGPDVTLQYGEEWWIAMLAYYDFDMGPSPQHVTISQIYHGGVNSGLNPFYGVSLYQDKLSVEFRHCAVVGMTKADQVLVSYPITSFPSKRGQWVDIVAKFRLDWDPAGDGYVKLWIDGVQEIDYVGPIGYRGPALVDGVSIPLAPEMRFGNYPGAVSEWTPDLPRDVYIRRGFLWKDVGAYTIEQVRAALQA